MYPERFKNFLLYGGIIVVCAVPFLLNYYQFNKVPDISDYIHRIGVEYTHMPELGQSIGQEIFLHYALYLLLLWLVYKTWYRNDRLRAVFFLASLLAMFVVWNIQIVTGFVPHPDHWGKPISIMLLFIISNLLSEFLYSKIPYRYITAALCIGVILLFGKATVNVYTFLNPPKDIQNSYTFNEDVVDSWSWINAHLPGEPKIISPSLATSYYLYSYTKARPYLPTAENSMAPNSVLEDRYLVANKFFNVSPSVMIEGLHDGDNYRHAFLYYIYYKKLGSDINNIPDEKIGELERKYEDMKPEWSDVDTDYVYYGPEERSMSTIDFMNDDQLELYYQNPAVQIFKIKK